MAAYQTQRLGLHRPLPAMIPDTPIDISKFRERRNGKLGVPLSRELDGQFQPAVFDPAWRATTK